MTCSICLDTYEDGEEEKAKRPVALPCGHIFHKECSDSWLKSCRMRNDPACCPLCKIPLGSNRALSLYPGDVNDLASYLAHRNRRVAIQQQHPKEGQKIVPATMALDRHMTREAQGQLLGSLMDFRQHINAYIMSVNNVSMSTSGGEDRIFRLFGDFSKTTEETQAEFESAIESLSTASRTLEQTIIAFEQERSESEHKNKHIKEEYARVQEMKRSLEKHLRVKSEEEQRMNKERSRISRLEMHCKKELQGVEQEREKMERERKAYIEEAREKEREAIRTRVECAQTIAQSKGTADSAVENMKNYLQEQERLRIEAEDRAREVLKKNSFLADRLKRLSEKLDVSRKELAQVKESGEGKRKVKKDDDDDDNDGDNVLTGYAIKEEGELLQEKGKTKQSSRRSSRQSSIFLRSEPSSQDQLEDDGFVVEGYKPGPHKRARLPSIRDDSTVVVIDSSLDEDFDDGNYPMPGFHHQHHQRQQQGASNAVRRFDDDDDDDTIEIVGERRSRRRSLRSDHTIQPPISNNLLQRIYSTGNLVLGPRQRAR